MSSSFDENLAVLLSHEIESLGDGGESPDPAIASLVRGTVRESTFSDHVNRDVDTLLAGGHRLPDELRRGMLRGADRALGARRTELAEPDALEILRQTLLELPDADDVFRTLETDPERSIDPIIESRAAADQLVDMIDAVTYGKVVAPQDIQTYVHDLDRLIEVTKIDREVVRRGITEAVELAENHPMAQMALARGAAGPIPFESRLLEALKDWLARQS